MPPFKGDFLSDHFKQSPSTNTSPSLGHASPYNAAPPLQTEFHRFWDDKLEAPKYLLGPSPTATTKASTSNASAPTKKAPKPAKNPDNDGQLFFFNMSDPSQPIPKSQMRPIRQHVMRQWLHKNQGDNRGKRKRIDSGYAAASQPKLVPEPRYPTPAASIATDCSSRSKRASTFFDNVEGIDSSSSTNDDPDDSNNVESEIYAYIWQGFPDVLYRPVMDNGQTMLYLATPIFSTFLHNDGISGKINPFKEWPKFPRPDVEVERLKWLCSRRFGSRALASNWVPTLMQTRHAFYSTICISAAHDDAMNCELGIDNVSDSARRKAIRESILQMITESMQGDEITDGTIISVLHVLYGELISGDNKQIETNHNGLHIMIQHRGGLAKLGMAGSLARIVVITMHFVAILHEQMPKEEYTAHAKTVETEPPPSDRYIPESPVYTVSGFALRPDMPMKQDTVQELLVLMSRAVSTFGARHKIEPQSILSETSSEQTAERMLQSYHDRIFTFKRPANIQMDARAGTTEAVRLASRIFARALARKVPISHAARLLEDEQASQGSVQQPLYIQIKDAIRQTPLDDCWGPHSGILLWIGLVALASASGRIDQEELDDDTLTANMTAKRFLTAVTTRCFILQSFEYTMSLLGMLKRFVAIQQVLAEGVSKAARKETRQSSLSILQEGRGRFGPSASPDFYRTTVGDVQWQLDLSGPME